MIEAGDESRPSILIIDDEPEILNSLADLLRKDFHILATTDTREALKLLRSRRAVSIIISDQRMPVMTGNEFLALAAAIAPDTQRILLTAHSDIDAIIDAVNRGGIIHYVAKPWDGGALIEKLKLIAERHLLFQENQRQVDRMLNSFATAIRQEAANTSEEELICWAHSGERNIRMRNELLHRANQQIERSQWLLGSLKITTPKCLRCGKLISSIPKPESVVGDKASLHVSGIGYCSDCRKMLLGLQEETGADT